MSDCGRRPEWTRGWRQRLAWRIIASLIALAAVSAMAQTQSGAVAGKLTDIHSRPLEGVAVSLRHTATGASVHAITGRGGTYRFTGLPSGEYTLEAVSTSLGRGEAGGVYVAAGFEAKVQTAVALTLEPKALFNSRATFSSSGSALGCFEFGPFNFESAGPALRTLLGNSGACAGSNCLATNDRCSRDRTCDNAAIAYCCSCP